MVPTTFFAILALMLCTGQILVSPAAIPSSTAAPNTNCHTDRELKVDDSNSVLGDMPILPVPDHKIDIINRRHVPLRNCKELLDDGSFNKSGLYVVHPDSDGGEFVVYCDMTLLGGGWTVIQRRVNAKLPFDRSIASYKKGFGDFAENFWLGLDKISRLTDTSNSESSMEVYFGMEAFFPFSAFSHYTDFSVSAEDNGYMLRISGYNRSSTGGNAMMSQNNQNFSTYDNDQDLDAGSNCAQERKGGWWFKHCHNSNLVSNLNGIYHEKGQNVNVQDGISWSAWLGSRYSLKTAFIAIRPRN